jgi:hypothetical protein
MEIKRATTKVLTDDIRHQRKLNAAAVEIRKVRRNRTHNKIKQNSCCQLTYLRSELPKRPSLTSTLFSHNKEDKLSKNKDQLYIVIPNRSIEHFQNQSKKENIYLNRQQQLSWYHRRIMRMTTQG